LAVEAPLRLDLPVSESWFVALEGGPGFPITRYRLIFEEPETEIHPVSAVTLGATLQAGILL
jgi:hypothetical protein